METPLIETRKLSKIYHRKEGGPIQALTDVDLAVNKGEFLAIVGRSGSGKTTILSIIGALDRPSSGEVIFEGRDTSKLSSKELAKMRREKIGFIFQDFNLLPTLTVLQNVEVALAPTDMPIEDQKKKAEEMLSRFELSDKLDSLPSELSVGQQEKVCIARALINNPSVILADEPTGEVDPITGRNIVQILVELNKKYNVTLVVITHGNFPYNIANRVIFMKEGKIVTCSEAGYEPA